jgi:hypothetical protein
MVGKVLDATGAVIPGAEITVTNVATDQVFTTTSSEKGEWALSSVLAAVYKVTVSKAGFRTETVSNVVVNAGVPATVDVKLEIGSVTEDVVVEVGAEILQTSSAAVSSTISGKQLFELPFATRNAVELLVTQPGVQTPTNPRSSTVNGLPRGALNVSIDGMNTQDNMLKSSDGFFSYIYPSVDALDELTVTSSASSADASGQGAAQIKFVTKSGGNQFHGGGFYQKRQTGWDANYYFNNEQHLPRDVVKLTQRGLHGGGPIKKDKAFFYANFEQYLLPGTKSYTRQVLTSDALNGNFSYCPTGTTNAQCVANPSLLRTINVYQLAGANGQVSTPDPILLKTLQGIDATKGGGTLLSRAINNSDYSRQDLNFQPNGNQDRKFFTTRLDHNITANHHLSLVYNYDKYVSVPDFLNNVVDAFPGSGVVAGTKVETGQFSNRFAGTLSFRSQFGPYLTNEARAGLNGGTVLFFPDFSPSLFTTWNGYRPVFGSSPGASLTNFVSNVYTTTSQQRRNGPGKTIADNLYYTRGSHQFAFGGEFTQINAWQQIASTDTMPSITFAPASGDPILSNTFVAANMPGSSTNNQLDAAGLYAILTGRVSSISKQLTLDEKTKQYAAVPTIDRNREREYGFFLQDTWRVRPDITVNAGVRIEKQGQYENLNGLYSRTGYAALWGLSGVGNLFKPGTLTGVTPTFIAQAGDPYNIPVKFGPAAGLAWQIPKRGGLLSTLFGKESGNSVLRVGYAESTVREGQNLFISLWGANQGITQTASVSPTTTPADFGAPGSVLFRGALPSKSGLVSTPVYPLAASFTTGLNDFKPNMDLGFVRSWNIGWQRQLSQNMAVEFRYTGNRGVNLWRQYNLDEVNIVESGFLNEFQAATNNLRIARGGNLANTSASNNWGNQGLPGQVAVPIAQTAIGNTTDATMAGRILTGQAGTAANDIALNSGRMANLTGASSKACNGGPCPVNLFVVNPTVASGGSFVETNDGWSSYDAFQVELTRRLSRGIQFQSSYVWSKSLANGPTNSSTSVSQPTTLRNMSIDKVPSGFDSRHAFKVNYTYEFPVGPGRRFWSSGNSVLGKAIEGWQTSGVVRVTSGVPFFVNGLGTFNSNSNTNGIALHNMTPQDLQNMVNIRKTTGSDGVGVVYYLPQSLINNTLAAYNTGGFTPAQLDPSQPYISPAPAGTLGWRGYLYQNWTRFFDVSLVKRTRVWESANIEFRATALNVFNMTNFGVGASGTNYNNIGSAFGQVSGAYRDISGTVEPGGRILEFSLRVNF